MNENSPQNSLDKKFEFAEKRTKNQKKSLIVFLSYVKDAIAVIFWIYVVIKLFVFDIDFFLIKNFLPDYAWLLNIKFFLLMGTLAIIFLITRNRYIYLWSAYILFYPFITIFWKIPIFIYKQKSWTLAFAFINAVISFINTLKYNFVTSAFFLVSTMLIFVSSNGKIMYAAATFILLILVISYVRRFFLVFKSSSIFQVYITIFSGIKKHGTSAFALDNSIKNISVEEFDEKQLNTWSTGLQTSVLFNRICLFVANKLKNYQNSGLNIAYYVFSIVLLILYTVFCFAVINLGLYKADPSLFAFSSVPNFFNFFYYSFNNLLFNQIPDLTAIKVVSQTVSMIESFFALFLVVIFVSLFITFRSQKHAEEFNEVIKGVEEQGKLMESFIQQEYKFSTIDEAMLELEKLKTGLAQFIVKITRSIE